MSARSVVRNYRYLYSQEGGISFKCRDDFKPSNVMDRWILSFTESLIAYVREEMASECGRGSLGTQLH